MNIVSSTSPSTSDSIILQSDVHLQLKDSQNKENAYSRRLKQLKDEVTSLFSKLEHQRLETKALKALDKNLPPEYQTSSIPSEQGRKPFEVISPQIRNLVIENVLYKGKMSYEEAAVTFKISRASVGRIIAEEKRGKKTLTKTIVKKRGRKSPLDSKILLYLLDQLENKSTLTLKEMVQDIENKFQISTSTSALDRKFSQMEITWKNTYEIPFDWNTAEVLEKRQQYIWNLQKFGNRPKIYIDESGFHLRINKSKGRALSGNYLFKSSNI